jgi:pimeloyl-ACP methyl ester carboxylesterase
LSSLRSVREEWKMSTYILCHGSWYQPSTWTRVAGELNRAGHAASTVSYPGDAGDETPASEITQQSYVDAVLGVVDAADEPVVLVGHSMGGMVISLASDQRPDRIEAAVYVSAFLLPDGNSIFDYSQSTPEFATSLLPQYLVVEPEKGISSIKPDGLRKVFLADASDEDFAWASERTQVDYLAPSGTPVSLDGGFSAVRRFYMETIEDRAVPVDAQRKMHSDAGVEAVASVDGSHSAYITRPDAVAAAIVGFGK